MPRKRRYGPLGVFLNSRRVGQLHKEQSGAIRFVYDSEWLHWQHAVPVSLSLPLREEAYSGAPVVAVFENLLPDNEAVRTRVASEVGAEGTDPYSLLAAIGKDCVGAMQFLADGDVPAIANTSGDAIDGYELSDQEIGQKINSLTANPLGLNSDDEFRISVAGAQEKTALLKHDDKWLAPIGTSPTTHIIKPQIGQLSNGMDLSRSVENEFLCLSILRCYGLPVTKAGIADFDGNTALVVERFDRRRLDSGRLIRLPQEDCCQALSCPSTRKYQRDGGPGIEDIMSLLGGSDEPTRDRRVFFKAQVLFWLLGATDGHAKNFSLALFPQGRFTMTPLYDVLTLQPSVDCGQLRHSEFKMAMRVGTSNQYRVHDIHGRHFIDTARKCGLSDAVVHSVFEEIVSSTDDVFSNLPEELPDDFPVELVDSVVSGVRRRLSRIEM